MERRRTRCCRSAWRVVKESKGEEEVEIKFSRLLQAVLLGRQSAGHAASCPETTQQTQPPRTCAGSLGESVPLLWQVLGLLSGQVEWIFGTCAMYAMQKELASNCTRYPSLGKGTVSGQKSESKPHFTAKLQLLTHPLTFLLVKQPQIFNSWNY